MTAVIGSPQFQRVSKKRPCPVCGRPDWCLISDDGTVAICPRTDAGASKRCGEAGWLHRLSAPHTPTPPRCRAVTLRATASQPSELKTYAARSVHHASRQALMGLAGDLGVSVESLHRLSVGWDGWAWTFPMKDHRGHIIGIRRRRPDGTKRAVGGSRNGLFLPEGLPKNGSLLISEGESDCAALLTLGFNCIGRPGCEGGAKFIVRFCRGREVVLIADRDERGKCGAGRLASVLACYCPSVRIVTPPTKDARAWIRAGATREDITAAIDASPILRLRIRAVAVRHGVKKGSR